MQFVRFFNYSRVQAIKVSRQIYFCFWLQKTIQDSLCNLNCNLLTYWLPTTACTVNSTAKIAGRCGPLSYSYWVIQQLRGPNYTQFWPPPPRVDKNGHFSWYLPLTRNPPWTFYWPHPPLCIEIGFYSDIS
jgi:hypothetical protein